MTSMFPLRITRKLHQINGLFCWNILYYLYVYSHYMTFTGTVVFILIQPEARGTLTAVASRLIGAVVFTVGVVHSAFVNICRQQRHLR